MLAAGFPLSIVWGAMFHTAYGDRGGGAFAVRPGDIIIRIKAFGVVEHKGFVYGSDKVLHNLPGRGEHSSSIAEFAAGNQIRVVKSVSITPEILQRVHYILRHPKQYDPFSWNCDHTVTNAINGEPISDQVEAFTGAALMSCAVLFLGALIFGKSKA